MSNAITTAVKQSIAALGKAKKEADASFAKLEKLEETAFNLAADIELKTSHLLELEESFKDEKRRFAINLDLAAQETEEDVLKRLLAKADLVSMPSTSLDDLEDRLAVATRNNEADVAKAVEGAREEMTMTQRLQDAEGDAQHKIQISELQNQLSSAHTTIKRLDQQVEDLQATLTAEREARVNTAKYSQPVANSAKD